MPKIREVGVEARSRLIDGSGRGKGYQERAPYREAIASLEGDRLIEIEPEGGENLRQLKVRLRRAAGELGREIQYGETREGTLLAWAGEHARRRERRGRRRTSHGQHGPELLTPQEEMAP